MIFWYDIYDMNKAEAEERPYFSTALIIEGAEPYMLLSNAVNEDGSAIEVHAMVLYKGEEMPVPSKGEMYVTRDNKYGLKYKDSILMLGINQND